MISGLDRFLMDWMDGGWYWRIIYLHGFKRVVYWFGGDDLIGWVLRGEFLK